MRAAIREVLLRPRLTWDQFHESLPCGSYRISSANLRGFDESFPDRTVTAPLGGQLRTILLLGCPMRVGERLRDFDGFQLHRIHLSELPGWLSKEHLSSSMFHQSRLEGARIIRTGDQSQSGLEVALSLGKERFNVWLPGIPKVLLDSAVTTLNQPGAQGTKVVDLQGFRLI